VICVVQIQNEWANRKRAVVESPRDAHPTSQRLTSLRRPGSADDFSVDGERSDVSFGRLVSAVNICGIQEGEDAVKVLVEPSLGSGDVRMGAERAVGDDATRMTNTHAAPRGQATALLCLLPTLLIAPKRSRNASVAARGLASAVFLASRPRGPRKSGAASRRGKYRRCKSRYTECRRALLLSWQRSPTRPATAQCEPTTRFRCVQARRSRKRRFGESPFRPHL
jgi:hypothetical protein